MFRIEAGGEKHMGGIQGTRGAGGTRGDRDALEIEVEKNGFPLGPRERDVQGIREGVCGVAVEVNVRYIFQYFFFA